MFQPSGTLNTHGHYAYEIGNSQPLHMSECYFKITKDHHTFLVKDHSMTKRLNFRFTTRDL
jgi:hypothetical protein